MDIRTTHAQFLRYTIIGLGSNIIIYLAYLALTEINIGHKTAMTVLYVAGIGQTFILNRTWSFRHEGGLHGAFARYVASYGLGYLLNFSVLWLAVDQLGMPHQIVQGVMIIIVALMIFVLQKFWVFPDRLLGTKEAT